MTEPTTAAGSSPLTSLLEAIGPRARRRGEPRTTITVAAAGCAVAVMGVLLIAGDAGVGDGDGGFNRWPGTILAALVVVGGVLAMRTVTRGPVASAGTIAVLLGLPVLVGLATFDTGSFPPFSIDSLLMVTTAGWLVAYVVGPGKGRPAFLGAGLVGAWLSVLQITEQPFSILSFFGLFAEMDDDAFFGAAFRTPDFFVIGLLSLAIGLSYGLATRWLDTRGHHGVATPFAVATIPAVLLGVASLADDLGASVTGLLLVVAGVALAHQGATLGRRATCWIGGLTVVTGVLTVIADAAKSAATAGLLLLLIGLCVVWASQLAHDHLDEPPDIQLSGGIRPFRRPKPHPAPTPKSASESRS
jgi:hypothetical protein